MNLEYRRQARHPHSVPWILNTDWRLGSFILWWILNIDYQLGGYKVPWIMNPVRVRRPSPNAFLVNVNSSVNTESRRTYVWEIVLMGNTITNRVERQQGERCKVSRIVADGKCIQNPKGFSLRFLLHTRTRTRTHTQCCKINEQHETMIFNRGSLLTFPSKH